jgi:tetratricopeptide (TPR) repeat protein
VHLWTADGTADPRVFAEWEVAVLEAPSPEVSAPAGVIVGELARGGTAEVRRIAWACIVLADTALARGAEETALAFTEAAALAWPEHARYAWTIGRMLRRRCRYREAEQWLRRAARVALRFKDWEARARSLNSLAMLHFEEGNFGSARSRLDQALRVASRHGIRRLQGEILHDRFAVEICGGNRRVAEEAARDAFERYLPDHPRLPALAYDLAYFWLNTGHAPPALPVLQGLLSHFEDPERRFQVLAAIARAAGALNQRTTFERVWSEAWVLLPQARSHARVPAALVDLGLGAASLGDWRHADEALTRALEAATAGGQAEDRLAAERALSAVERQDSANPIVRAPRPSRDESRFAARIVEVLESTVMEQCIG